MPQGSISSSDDAVGVAVFNYEAPILETREQVLKNCKEISSIIDGMRRGYPGLDLIVFPEFSTQGFHPLKWADLTTRIGGPETEIFSEACRRNKVYGIFSLTGEEHPEGKNPYNTLIMINDQGEVVLTYRKIFPWVPQEPWTAGEETAVAEGPKGLMVGGVVCYDASFPEIIRDTVMKGAELIVRIQGYMYPTREQQRLISQVRAWENLCYFAVSNLAGRDLVYSFFGQSNIVDFDGRILGECGSAPFESTYATLSLTTLRDARRNWTAENHLYNILHRGYTSEPGGRARCPFDFYRKWIGDPDGLRDDVEALTRDHDNPVKATTAPVRTKYPEAKTRPVRTAAE